MNRLFPLILVAALVGGPAANADFQTGLSAFGQGDFVRADSEFRAAHAAGNPNGSFMLGVMAEEGLGRPVNLQEAIGWYRLAADAGLASAQYNLGIAYQTATGVSPSLPLAVQWFRRAALQGHGKAMNNLGNLYEAGVTGERDYEQAWFWFRLAERFLPQNQATVATRNREQVEGQLSPEQLAPLRQQAEAWQPVGQ